MTFFKQCLLVGAGGFLGSIARFLVAVACGRIARGNFPFGTMVINISGTLFLGWFLGTYGSRLVTSDALRLSIAVGFVGAYTTFSTFMYESSTLMTEGLGVRAAANLIGSLVLGLIAFRVGVALARVGG